MSLRVKLLRSTGKVPTVGHPGEDIGYDLYADPLYADPDPTEMFGVVELLPHTITPVHTGISIEFQPKAGGLILTRSSMAKKGIIVVGGVIDAGYRGEIIVMLANLTNKVQNIAHGDKIAQLAMFPHLAQEAQPVAELTFASRGEGGFGSTGR